MRTALTLPVMLSLEVTKVACVGYPDDKFIYERRADINIKSTPRGKTKCRKDEQKQHHKHNHEHHHVHEHDDYGIGGGRALAMMVTLGPPPVDASE